MKKTPPNPPDPSDFPTDEFPNGYVFRSEQAKRVIEYVAARYGDRPEFLWAKFPRNAIFRRRDCGKWYAAILDVARNKLGLPGDGSVEILNLRVPTSEIGYLVDGELFLPAYHMNKRCWFSIRLDGSLSTDEIFERIDASFESLSRRPRR